MPHIQLIFPHHLFQDTSSLPADAEIVLIEEALFFRQYPFHQQKIAFHRASMKQHEQWLLQQDFKVTYIPATDERSDVRVFIKQLDNKVKSIKCYDPVDDWLSKRLEKACHEVNIDLRIDESPLFINSSSDLEHFFKPKKKQFHQTTFYKQQRKSRDLLMKGEDPKGGKWTFDKENRKKYPKGKTPPAIHFPSSTKLWKEACEYVDKHFENHYGQVNRDFQYPTTGKEAEEWLTQFFDYRFHAFGDYEDAIVQNESILNHSVLSPLINVGLLHPMTVVEKAIHFAEHNDVPINSLEGFVRQIIGWREFIRGMYVTKGVQQRNTNFWEFDQPMPSSFYDASTNIQPVDVTIQKVLETGYCHHIERLMILANFMTLCEINPVHIYQWFMELFIDAYDWVMVPNVYGMATFSDGGLMSTKPYISGSNYINKMSDYKSGKWEDIWDGLFWRFMSVHRTKLSENARINMLLSTLDRMNEDTLQEHLDNANEFLETLHR